MVDGAAKGDDGVGSRLQREVFSASGQLPDDGHDRDEVREDGLPGDGIPIRPVVDRRAVVRRQGAETEAVQVDRFEIVVVEEDVLVALVGALLRSLAASAAVDFLHDEPAGGGMGQQQVHDAPLRDHDLVRRAVEEVLARSVAAGDAVDARGNLDFGEAAPVGLGQVGRAGGDFLDANDGPFVDGMGIADGIDGIHRQQLQGVRPRTLVVLDTGRCKQRRHDEKNPFHSLIRQVSP